MSDPSRETPDAASKNTESSADPVAVIIFCATALVMLFLILKLAL